MAITTNKSFMIALLVALIIIIFDQLTKIWIVQNLVLHDVIPVNSFFSIAHAHNYGAAFGFLNNAGGWQTIFFTVVAFIVSTIMIVWLKRIAGIERQLSLALSLVLGGAIGNVIDRIQYGYVVDFIVLYYDKWQFPAFNIADSAITIGAILLLMDSFGWKILTDVENA